MIGFRFLLTVVGKRQQAVADRPLAGDPFADMMGQRMRNLVRHHGRELIVVANDGKQARENADFPAGQAEGIDLVVFEDAIFPFEFAGADVQIDLAHQRFDGHDGGDPLADFSHPFDLRAAMHDAGFGKNFLDKRPGRLPILAAG